MTIECDSLEGLLKNFLMTFEGFKLKCIFRYCCQSNKMYRPQSISFFEQMIPPVWPIGPLKATVVLSKTEAGGSLGNINLTVFCCYSNAPPSIIVIK